MVHLIILGAVVIVPVGMIVFLRANAAIAFMGLCVGSVLAAYTSSDVTSFVTAFSPVHSVLATTQWAQLILLVVPFLLSMWFTRRSVKGSFAILNFLIAIISGVMLALFVVPLLSSPWQHVLEGQSAWQQLTNLQTMTVLSGATLSLVFILATHSSLRHSGSKHSK
ncbi:MAG: hypothetical protein ABI220_03185 [Candidatus Saccharimonadales bacterium]